MAEEEVVPKETMTANVRGGRGGDDSCINDPRRRESNFDVLNVARARAAACEETGIIDPIAEIKMAEARASGRRAQTAAVAPNDTPSTTAAPAAPNRHHDDSSTVEHRAPLLVTPASGDDEEDVDPTPPSSVVSKPSEAAAAAAVDRLLPTREELENRKRAVGRTIRRTETNQTSHTVSTSSYFMVDSGVLPFRQDNRETAEVPVFCPISETTTTTTSGNVDEDGGMIGHGDGDLSSAMFSDTSHDDSGRPGAYSGTPGTGRVNRRNTLRSSVLARGSQTTFTGKDDDDKKEQQGKADLIPGQHNPALENNMSYYDTTELIEAYPAPQPGDEDIVRISDLQHASVVEEERPEESQEQPSQDNNPKSRRLGGLVILCLLVLAIIVGGVALAVWRTTTTKEDEPPTTSVTTTTTTKEEEEPTKVLILALDKKGEGVYPSDKLPYHGKELGENARDFMAARNGQVEIEIQYVKTMPELWQEIESDALTGGSLFDAYYTNPVSIGAATQLGGLMDFTPYIRSYPNLDWLDVLPAYRKYATNYDEKVQLILLDGDTHFLYYRKDVLDHFGLQVPRTWDEYNEVAKATHGRVFEGKTLSGSCIGRQPGDHAQFWYHLVHSTITQTKGTETGSLLDTKTGRPLLGEALAETMRLHEEQAKYGSSDEFTGTLYEVIQHIHDGTCTLSYYWGDIFKTSKSNISLIGNEKLGVAKTPGSRKVLDRETGELVPCTQATCPFGKYYEDIGWVNSAPYIANGGWGGAVSANTDKHKQDILADFFLWSTSRDQSMQYVIPNATGSVLTMNTQDPWRKSHLNIDEWVKRGYDEANTKQYVETLLHNTNSENAVVEMRFPKAGDLYAILDKDVYDYMYRTKQGDIIAPEDKAAERMRIAQEMERKWNLVIQRYDNRHESDLTILQQYQILRDVSA